MWFSSISTSSEENSRFATSLETRHEHIVLDESGVPMIAGTTMKVIQLILDSKAYG